MYLKTALFWTLNTCTEVNVALIVAQSRDRQNRLSGIKLTSLSLGLKRIALAAKKMKATIHLPRIGYNTPSFNWYGTERLLRKHLVCKGIQTSVYYFDRQSATNNSKTLTSLNADSLKKRSYKAKDKRETSKDDESSHGEHRKSTKHSLPDFMYGVNVLFHNVEETHRKQLTRYLVAYPLISIFICFESACSPFLLRRKV
nr:chromodomain-helicase-DNA-binding protein 1-like [Pocillopora verrucosa]